MTALRDRLRQAIVTGEIEPGASRTQAQLAEFLSVSRTPLREVLRMLELEHLIVRESNGRFRAADLSADEMEQLGMMRIALEAAAVRITVPELTNADHATLEGLHAESQRLAEVGEWAAFEDANRRFHVLLTQEAGAMHSEQLERLWEQETRYRQALEGAAELNAGYSVRLEEHRQILDAAEARDGEQAARLAAQHHARVVREIFQYLDPERSTERLELALALETESHPGKLDATKAKPSSVTRSKKSPRRTKTS